MKSREELLKMLDKKKKNHEPYSSLRWYDDPGFKIIQGREKDITKEEEERSKKAMKEMLDFVEKNKHK